MKNVTKGVVAAAVVAGSVWIPRQAFALGPVDLEVAAKVGGGTSTVSGGGPNPLGFGLGGRAGVSIFGFYGGLAAMYYLGESADTALNGLGSVHTQVSSTLVGLEGGYNLGLSILTIRPQLGLGYYNAGFSLSYQGAAGAPGPTSQNTSSVYLEPDITALVSLGIWFVGADAGLLWVPAVDNSQVAVVVHGQVGIKL
jgi:hypothetical protein